MNASIIKKSIFEILKIFLSSTICSLLFYSLISKEAAITEPFICFFLNTASLLLFLFLVYRSWARVYDNSNNALEYFVPTITSFVVYVLTSVALYSVRFFLYMWIFLPTRFLEPQLAFSIAPLSILVTYALMAVLLFATPILYTHRR
ncbi:MAG: hypothetical protein IJV86_01160 [Clostridia bacterium]|nr:hypothetical protein [Clostridia bacterium]